MGPWRQGWREIACRGRDETFRSLIEQIWVLSFFDA